MSLHAERIERADEIFEDLNFGVEVTKQGKWAEVVGHLHLLVLAISLKRDEGPLWQHEIRVRFELHSALVVEVKVD